MNMILGKDIEIKLLAECQEYIPQLAVLWYKEISRHWVSNASIDRAEQNLIMHLNLNLMPLTFVALYQEKPIGMVSLRENDGIRPDLTPWLGSLVVDPDHRRCKLGEKLIEVVKNQAKIFGYDKLYLLAFDKTISTWYSKLGWVGVGSDQLFGHPVDVMFTSCIHTDSNHFFLPKSNKPG